MADPRIEAAAQVIRRLFDGDPDEIVSSRKWERVTSRGTTVYWRLLDESGRSRGAVYRRDDGWRALLYGKDTPTDNEDLGTYTMWQAARKRVLVVDSARSARFDPTPPATHEQVSQVCDDGEHAVCMLPGCRCSCHTGKGSKVSSRTGASEHGRGRLTVDPAEERGWLTLAAAMGQVTPQAAERLLIWLDALQQMHKPAEKREPGQ